jgi:hypothetical protein
MIKNEIAVIGGGFYGLWISEKLIRNGNKVTLFERESELMLGASRINQARIHAGHHYARSIKTFSSSNRNYSKFLVDFNESIFHTKFNIYAIEKNSMTSIDKFIRLNGLFESKLVDLPNEIAKEFNRDRIKQGWLVDESFYNSNKLRDLFRNLFNSSNFKYKLECNVTKLRSLGDKVKLESTMNSESKQEIFDGAIISTYGNFEMLENMEEISKYFKYEVCEIINVEVPTKFKNIAITVIDGPFWSLTPWPTFGNHALTHVRYTPHAVCNTYGEAKNTIAFIEKNSNFALMKNEIAKYSSELRNIRYIKSHFVVKSVSRGVEANDSRSIFFNTNFDKNILTIVGGKIDNIYDIEDVILDFIARLGVKNV